VPRKQKKQIDIELELCFGCGDCVVSCPINLVKEKKGEKDVAMKVRNGKVVLYREICTGCGFCASYCPTKAITVIPVE
jgi:4Fe-4S ferredoxin